MTKKMSSTYRFQNWKNCDNFGIMALSGFPIKTAVNTGLTVRPLLLRLSVHM